MRYRLNRRELLAASAAFACAPVSLLAAPTYQLDAAPTTIQILPEGEPPTQLLGFNGSSPGPEIRIRQGDQITILFRNGTDQPSAIHWHGIHLQNAMDGVPDLTQTAVEPGGTFQYSFSVPHAGTFWYHSHHRSWEQVARGLYGPLIVEEQEPPAVDHDVTITIDDWLMEADGKLRESFGNLHDFSHAGRMGNFARIFSTLDAVRVGDRVRLRLINAATARFFPMTISGGVGMVVAYDGMPLSRPEPLGELLLAPAQRADIILDVTGPVTFDLVTREGPYNLGMIAVRGVNPTPVGSPIAALPPANVPEPDLNGASHLLVTMQGGAMGGRHGGEDFWAFNDQSGLSDKPLRHFARGETSRLTLRNDTAFPHGIHLHGHHFHEIRSDGTLGHFRDTTIVDPEESRDVLCTFTNPGKWLLHCHTLGHQASGMKTWVDVA